MILSKGYIPVRRICYLLYVVLYANEHGVFIVLHKKPLEARSLQLFYISMRAIFTLIGAYVVFICGYMYVMNISNKGDIQLLGIPPSSEKV